MLAEDVKSSAFPKSCRLKSSLRIKDIVQQRHFVFSYPIKCFYDISTAKDTKLAVIVTKKRFPHATDRNRVKRLMREAYRLNCHQLILPNQSGVEMCWMYVGGELPTYKQMCAAAEHVFSELQSVVNEEAGK